MNSPVEWAGEDALLRIHAQPGAKQTSFAGQHGEAIKIRLAAPPLEGRANQALFRFLSEVFAVPLSAITLMSGESARQKRVKIQRPVEWPDALKDWKQ